MKLTTLHSTIQLYSRVFIIIDALDEYYVSEECLHRLLSRIFNLQMQGDVNIFATSHFIPDIEAQFEGFISKEIPVKDDDMLRYVNGRIPPIPRNRN